VEKYHDSSQDGQSYADPSKYSVDPVRAHFWTIVRYNKHTVPAILLPHADSLQNDECERASRHSSLLVEDRIVSS
jgi:hypothetical protein